MFSAKCDTLAVVPPVSCTEDFWSATTIDVSVDAVIGITLCIDLVVLAGLDANVWVATMVFSESVPVLSP